MRRQAIGLVVARSIGSLLQAILFIVYARTVDPTEFGRSNTALALLSIAGVVADAGATPLILRMQSFGRDAREVARVIAFSRYTSLALAVVGYAAILLLGLVWWRDLTPWLGGFAVWVALEKYTEAQTAVMIGRHDTAGPIITTLVRRSVAVALFVVLVVVGIDGTVAVVIALVVGGVAAQTLVRRYTRRNGIRTGWRMSPRSVLAESIPYALTSVAGQLRNLDTPIVGVLINSTAAGAYAASLRLAMPVFLVSAAVSTSVVPAVARGGVRLARLVVVCSALGVVGLVVVVLSLSGVAGGVMGLVFGSAYARYGVIAVAVGTGAVASGGVSMISSVLQACGRAHYAAALTLGGNIAFVLAISIGAMLGGVVAAAVAAAVVACFLFVVMDVAGFLATRAV